jgi:HD-GYP domain-containing protein (c-di-GMP phosphodiesterase class II)
MLGHSQRVSQTCGLSAMAVGLNSEKSAELQLAAHVHDLGRVTIATGTWDRPGPLTAYERESLRAHPSMMRSFLNQIPPLRSVAALASTACERLDGSGYPRGLASSLLGPAERLLAAADVFVALTSDRPHRPAFSRTMAARLMGEDVSAGRLDRRSVNAVLDGAEVRRPKLQIALPDSLSLREAEVILLLAQGLKNKDIALRLNISPRTVQTHVAHIFDKTGFRSRAGAALYSIRHGLADIQHFDG